MMPRLDGFGLIEAIREKGELAVKPEQSLQVIHLIEAAMKSNLERKAININ